MLRLRAITILTTVRERVLFFFPDQHSGDIHGNGVRNEQRSTAKSEGR